MDHGVQLADGAHRQAGRVERSPGATTVTRSATSGASSRILAATASMVNTGASVRAQVVGQVVVGVLVGDQHRVGAVDGLGR